MSPLSQLLFACSWQRLTCCSRGACADARLARASATGSSILKAKSSHIRKAAARHGLCEPPSPSVLSRSLIARGPSNLLLRRQFPATLITGERSKRAIRRNPAARGAGTLTECASTFLRVHHAVNECFPSSMHGSPSSSCFRSSGRSTGRRSIIDVSAVRCVLAPPLPMRPAPGFLRQCAKRAGSGPRRRLRCSFTKKACSQAHWQAAGIVVAAVNVDGVRWRRRLAPPARPTSPHAVGPALVGRGDGALRSGSRMRGGCAPEPARATKLASFVAPCRGVWCSLRLLCARVSVWTVCAILGPAR